MATSQSSHSLSSTAISPQAKKKRPAQLPLPSSNFSATPAHHLQSLSATSNRFSIPDLKPTNALNAHSRSISTVTRKKSVPAHTFKEHPTSSPPTITTFQIPPVPTGTTHAGGILPSASFFHPSRPNHPDRPSSEFSMNEVLPVFASGPDHIQLTSFARQVSRGESDEVSGPSPTDELHRQLSKRMKHSREPLLPVSNRQNTFDGRTSASVDDAIFPSLKYKMSTSSPPTRSTSISPSRPHTSLSGPGNRMFVSAAPGAKPSLFAVPIPGVRVYQKHPSRNTFFCGGRMLTGGDTAWAFVVSLVAVFGIAGVWFGTTCVWWWRNESPAVAAVGAYMCLLTISSMFATAFRDPGILPRNLDPDPPFPSRSPSDGAVRAPLPRDLKVRNDTVRVKYCATCKTYRPPRSSHCKMCDNCVDGCDHHCQWVNNCVGRRNYTCFFAFLLSATLTLCLVICTSALQLYIVTRREHVDLRHALDESSNAGSAVAFVLSALLIWPVTVLLAYHIRLLVLNVTTIEQIRNQAHKTIIPDSAPPNPFSYGSWRYNLAEVLCHPAGFSWLDGPAYATEDKRDLNPGLEEAAVVLGWEGGDPETTVD